MTDDLESNNPDRLEKGIRLGCGATFGVLFGVLFSLWEGLVGIFPLLFAGFFAGLFAFLAMRHGDAFWKWWRPL